jgi:hypothetical protein
LDPFAGGGTTVYESAKLGRAVVGCDLNPLSNFIVRNMLVTSDSISLTEAASSIVEYIRSISKFTLPDCAKCSSEMDCEWAELCHVAACPECGKHISLNETNKVRPGLYLCSDSSCKSSINGFKSAKTPRLKPKYSSLVLGCTACNYKSEVPVDERLLKAIEENVSALEALVIAEEIKLDQTDIPLNWDRQKEDLLFEKGFIKFSDFFTRRNFLINSVSKAHIIRSYESSEVYEPLRFIFSDSLRDTNSMSFTNKAWQAGKPTTWSKHAYWLPNEFCEVNVAKAFARAFRSLASSHLFNHKHKFKGKLIEPLSPSQVLRSGEVYLHPGSIETLNLKSNSIDAVITDPPYGSNVQYLELSHFWHPWNSDVYQNPITDTKSEAVVNRKVGFEGAKGYIDYEENLYRVFSSSFTALKPGGSLALTFNNKDLRAWVALIMSILRSGFRYSSKSIVFQDGVENYRQTAHTRFNGSPFGDFVYVFSKPNGNPGPDTQTVGEDSVSLSKSIDSITGKAFALLDSGAEREKVLTKYFDKLVEVIQGAYLSTTLDTDTLYKTISSSQLGKFYSGSNK